ncbi:MAG: prepilin-type N-terminal cleavage/methylation domain-containing protein [Desulfobacterales bacterium]|nr:prepilin-type N-terminal cleavage/methylation domain-containing protein [Desulfobacterales bacterium]MCF8079964.1 prepilin-type N-terminal cleavage/methylation domain-containing protein [Desulfobacterales bacterium]
MSPSGDHGFTLLEILAAVAILAIVLTALFRLHLQTLSMGADSRFYSIAPLLAQGKIAEIETEGIDQVRSDSGSFDDPFDRYRWEAAVSETESAEFDELTKMLRRIDLTVVDDANGSTYTLRTYRYLK